MKSGEIRRTPEIFYPRHRYFTEGFPFFIGRCFHNSEAVNESVFHRRDFWKITYYFSGNGEYLLNDRRYPIRDGSVVVSHPRSRTTCRILSGELGLYNILFLPELLDDELKKMENSFDFFSIFHPEEPASSDLYVTDTDRGLRGIVYALYREFRRREPNYRTMIRLRLAELLIAVSRRSIRCYRESTDANVVEYITRRIEHGFRGTLTLETLAVESGISKTRLCLLFRRGTGETVMGALRRRRLHEARRLLAAAPALPVVEVALKSGFNDLSHFYHLFSREFGITPLEYRRKKNGPEPA